MSKNSLQDVMVAVLILAAVFILVRPNSVAPLFIDQFGQAMTALVEFAQV